MIFRFCRSEMSLFCLFFLNIILPSSDSSLAAFSFLVYVLWALDRLHILLLFYKCPDSVVGWCCWVLSPCCFYVRLLLLLLRGAEVSVTVFFFLLISPVGFFSLCFTYLSALLLECIDLWDCKVSVAGWHIYHYIIAPLSLAVFLLWYL